MSVQRRLATMPWPLLLLLYLVAMVAGGAVAAFVAAGKPWPSWAWSALGAVAVLLAVAGVVTREVRQRRLRAQGRYEAVLAAVDAVQTGRAPADPAARAETRRLLAQQRALLPLYQWVGPVLFGALALSQVFVVIDGGPRKLVQLAVFASLAVGYPLTYRRMRPRLDALERDLGVGP